MGRNKRFLIISLLPNIYIFQEKEVIILVKHLPGTKYRVDFFISFAIFGLRLLRFRLRSGMFTENI